METFDARLAQVILITKTGFDTKAVCLNKKNNPNITKHLLIKKELKKQQVINSSYFQDKNPFEEDESQNY